MISLRISFTDFKAVFYNGLGFSPNETENIRMLVSDKGERDNINASANTCICRCSMIQRERERVNVAIHV